MHLVLGSVLPTSLAEFLSLCLLTRSRPAAARASSRVRMTPRLSAAVKTLLISMNASTAQTPSGLTRAQTLTSRTLQTKSGLHSKLLTRIPAPPSPKVLSRNSISRIVVNSGYWKDSRVRFMSTAHSIPPCTPGSRAADSALLQNVRDPDEAEGPLATEWPQNPESSKTLVLCLDGTGGEYDDDESSA